MQRMHIFLMVLTATLSALIILVGVSWYLAVTTPAYYGSSWMGQMWGDWGMGGMMGNGGYQTSVSPYLWIVPTGLIAIAVVSVIGVGFYLAFPQLRYVKRTCDPPTPAAISSELAKNFGTPRTTTASVEQEKGEARSVVNPAQPTNTCDVLMKTMTPEEQKILSILRSHQGKYLQKYMVKEAGLSRLKTHRIIARFVERGIVTANQVGNTNEIVLSEWVQNSQA